MSVINQLSSEFSTLIAESRRRNNDIKVSSEYSLEKLKSFNANNSKEADFLQALSHDQEFITPILLSFSSRNAKLSSVSIQSLSKLIQYHAIPTTKIERLLDALMEATYLAMDIQLKILQVLPTFYQIYCSCINDSLLSQFLQICSTLQAQNKSPMVINTASATEQQIVLSLFEKVSGEVSESKKKQKSHPVTLYEDEVEQLDEDAFDAYRVFKDYCSLINNQPPEFLPFTNVSEGSTLELIENILNSNMTLFQTHPELIFLLKTKLTPLLLRSFTSSNQFSITVRTSRIIVQIVRHHIKTMEVESEVILSLLNLTLTRESNLQPWKRLLTLEIYINLFQGFDVILEIFQNFDNNDSRKSIISDFFMNCNDLILDPSTRSLLNQYEIVVQPEAEKSITPLNSSLRTSLMDQLDKEDPPSVPRNYMLFLVLNVLTSFCDGVGNHTVSVSNKYQFSFCGEIVGDVPQEVSQFQQLIKSNAKSLISLGSEFLYASIHSDLFHSLVRSLQKLCHSAGTLSLDKERDSLLYLFSIAAISNVQKHKSKPVRNASITESIAETINYATGSTINANVSATTRPSIHPRDLNSRHIICFRALVSLTISFAPILHKSWRFVLITFQWFSYYVKGPSKHYVNNISINDPPIAPKLTPQDLKVIDSTIAKLHESTKNMSDLQFQSLVENLIELGRESVQLTTDYQVAEPIGDDGICLCPFNTDFYTVKIGLITEVNMERVLTSEGLTNWKIVFEYLKHACSSEQIHPESRLISAGILNDIFHKMATEGFRDHHQANEEIRHAYTESLLFGSLAELMQLVISNKPKATQQISTDSVIILDTLNTLTSLLDRFGTLFRSSWTLVIDIIRSIFSFYQTTTATASTAAGESEDNSTTANNKGILQASFGIIQLIMNDFIQCVPVADFRNVIEILEKFSSQDMQINVSFSSLSYYWLVSDHFKSLISSEEEDQPAVTGLWSDLLKSLINVCGDPRAEVRNGAIQTFFRIVDSHGDHLDWSVTFKSVVQTLLKAEIPLESDYEGKRKFQENCMMVLKGIRDIFIKFIVNSPQQDASFWDELLQFFSHMVSLDNVKIQQTVYEYLYQIMDSCANPVEFEKVFQFWSGQKIKYVSQDSNNYQNMVIQYIKLFEILNRRSQLSKDKLELSVSIFNNAARFPFLPDTVSTPDDQTCTNLQATILNILDRGFTGENEEEYNMVLLNISSLVLLPLSTRSRILKKLKNVNSDKVCSFIQLSVKSLQILREKLIQPLIVPVDQLTVVKIMKNLIETIKIIPEDDPAHLRKLENAEIWKQSLQLLLDLSVKLVSAASVSDGLPTSQWELIIQAFILTLPGENFQRDETFNIACYTKFQDLIFKDSNITQILSSSNETLINHLIQSFWDSSLLYEKSEIEQYLFQISKGSPDEITSTLMNSNILDFSTEPLILLPQQRFRLICFNDFFSIATKSNQISQKLIPYIICRSVMIVKRFQCSQSLLNRAPVGWIQQKELESTLQHIVPLLSSDNYEKEKSEIKKIIILVLKGNLHVSKEFQSSYDSILCNFYDQI